MNMSEEAYEVDGGELGDFESFEEVRRRPARPVSIPGVGVATAFLQTPRGQARLNLPATVATVAQVRALEQGLNGQAQRLNTVTAELARVRRELMLRRREQQGLGSLMFPLLMMKKLRDDFEGHTHQAGTGAVVLPPAAASGGLSTLLPLLLFAPGMFGGSSSGAGSTGSAENMQPLLMAFVFAELF